MRDVATAAGVGVKTVSRVVNNERHVSHATRAAVQRAIAKLGFTRDESAASLRGGRSGSIGLILQDIALSDQATIARAVELVVFDHGSLLYIASSGGDPKREQELVRALIARRVDGLIILSPRNDRAHVQAEIEAGLPIAFIDRPIDPPEDTALAGNGAGEGETYLSSSRAHISYDPDYPALTGEAAALAVLDRL